MRNLNNFPDDLFELSGKRLIAIAIGFSVFSGTLGAILTHKLIRRDLLANEIHQEYLAQNPPLPTATAASSEQVAKEWSYPTRMSSRGGNGKTYDITGETPDDYKKVWQHYADKIDYPAMIRGNGMLPVVERSANVGYGTQETSRGVNNYYEQNVRYCQFLWEDKNTIVRVYLTPLKTGTYISTFAYSKAK